jgi:hypothetical protein
MKNTKINLEIIEHGRLSKEECGLTIGGATLCSPTYRGACALFTSCTSQGYGITSDDGAFTSLCGGTNRIYNECIWFPPLLTAYGG